MAQSSSSVREVMSSVTLVGCILSWLDEISVERLMRLERDDDGRAKWPTVRGINWAWRVAFDVCAPKTIGVDTYWLYASPEETLVARGRRGYSASCMHTVRRLELVYANPEYHAFLQVCSPCQFSSVTRVSVCGCLFSMVEECPAIGNILMHASLEHIEGRERSRPHRLSSSYSLDGVEVGGDVLTPVMSCPRHAPPCSDSEFVPPPAHHGVGAGVLCSECDRVSRCKDAWDGVDVVWDALPVSVYSPECPVVSRMLHAFLPTVRRLSVVEACSVMEVVSSMHGMRGLREIRISMMYDGQMPRNRRLRILEIINARPPVSPLASVVSATIDPRRGVDVDLLRGMFNDRGGGAAADVRLLFPSCTIVSFVGGPMSSYVRSFFMPRVTRVSFDCVSLLDGETYQSISTHGNVYAELLALSFRGCSVLRVCLCTPPEHDELGQSPSSRWCGGWWNGEADGALPRLRGAGAIKPPIRDGGYYTDVYPAKGGIDGREYLLATLHWMSYGLHGGREVTIEVDPVLADFMRLSEMAGDTPDFVHPGTCEAYYVVGRVDPDPLGCCEDSEGGVARGPLVALTRTHPCCRNAPRGYLSCPHTALDPASAEAGRGFGVATYRLACRSCSDWIDSPEKLLHRVDGLPPSARAALWCD